MTPHDDAFDDALAAFALDALDAADRPALEAHLATCERCQAELVELRRVTAALGETVDPVQPPESLKAKVLARAIAGAAAPKSRPAPVAAWPAEHRPSPVIERPVSF